MSFMDALVAKDQRVEYVQGDGANHAFFKMNTYPSERGDGDLAALRAQPRKHRPTDARKTWAKTP